MPLSLEAAPQYDETFPGSEQTELRPLARRESAPYCSDQCFAICFVDHRGGLSLLPKPSVGASKSFLLLCYRII